MAIKVKKEELFAPRFFPFANLISMFDESVYSPSYVTLYLKVLNDHLNGYDEECAETYLVTVKISSFDFDIIEVKRGNFDYSKSEDLFESVCDFLTKGYYDICKIAMCRYPYVSVFREEYEIEETGI